MDLDIAVTEVFLRMGLSLVLGAIVGWEREARQKPAGLRTHMLVCLGSATFTLLALEFAAAEGPATLRIDPIRIIEGIAGGLGFLGAGTIIQARASVRGLTTAAGLWVVGAIGVACGAGHYLVAGVAGAAVVIVLLVVGRLEAKLAPRAKPDRAEGPDCER